MFKLDGKIAIITGAAKGLGAADATMMSAQGARVILCDVDTAGIQELAAEIGDAAESYRLDVSIEAEWERLIAHVAEKYGRLDILVNNAGVVVPGTIENQTEKDYRFQMAVSADGTFFGSKHALPLMVKGGGGSIVNIASIAAVQGERYCLAYSAAKGAVTGMTRSIAAHCALEKNNVRCNAICPSGMLTPMVMSIPEKLAAVGMLHILDDIDGKSMPSRIGEPKDIAATVCFLASDEARYINGATISVDHGISIIPGLVTE